MTAKYDTEYSKWVFEKPDEVTTRHSNVDTYWTELTELSVKKKKVLDDHLAREEYRCGICNYYILTTKLTVLV